MTVITGTATAATVAAAATVAGAATSIGTGIYGAVAAGDAADAQQSATGQSIASLSAAERKAIGLLGTAQTSALAEYDPFSNLGVEGRNLLGLYLGLESLFDKGKPQGPDAHLEQLKSQKATLQADINQPNHSDWWKVKAASDIKKFDTLIAKREAEIKSQRAFSAKEAAAAAAAAKAHPDYGSVLSGFTKEDFVADPGYQFRKKEGLKGLSNLYGSQGNLLSGNALGGLTKFNQNYASNEFHNAYARDLELKKRRLGIATGLTGYGMHAADAKANIYQGTAANQAGVISNLAGSQAAATQDVGNISAAESVAKAQAYSNLFSGATDSISGLSDFYAAKNNPYYGQNLIGGSAFL